MFIVKVKVTIQGQRSNLIICYNFTALDVSHLHKTLEMCVAHDAAHFEGLIVMVKVTIQGQRSNLTIWYNFTIINYTYIKHCTHVYRMVLHI